MIAFWCLNFNRTVLQATGFKNRFRKIITSPLSQRKPEPQGKGCDCSNRARAKQMETETAISVGCVFDVIISWRLQYFLFKFTRVIFSKSFQVSTNNRYLGDAVVLEIWRSVNCFLKRLYLPSRCLRSTNYAHTSLVLSVSLNPTFKLA